jgi:hypothetical protein
MLKNVAVITFNSGTTIITQTAHEDETLLVLTNPMEMHIDNSDPIVQKIYLSRWNPFSADYMSVIYKSAVESMTLCSPRFAEIYASKLAAFEASKTQITDSDTTEVIEGSFPDDEGDDENEHQIDEYDEYGERVTEVKTKTYH